MYAASNAAHVDQLVEFPPACPAQAPDPARSRSNRQRNKQNECGESRGNEGALSYVFHHTAHIERLIEPDVSGEVQTGVEECEQAQQSTEANKPRLAGDLAQ